MKLLRTHNLVLLYIFFGCFSKCVRCDLDNEEEKSLRRTGRDEMEYLDYIDDSYFNERLKDNSSDDDIEGDNIFVRSPYLNSKYNSKDKVGRGARNKGKKTNLKHMMTDKTTGFVVSFILATLFISVLVIVAIIYKRHQMKKTAMLRESPNLISEAV